MGTKHDPRKHLKIRGTQVKISIASLNEVVKNIDFIKRNNINLISIRNTKRSPGYNIIDNAGLQNLLVVQFDDLITPVKDRSEKEPEESDIRTILEWSKQKMKENNNDFIVHCTAGVSRSPAVAILIQYLQDPENALKVINPILHSPNEKVLELGEKILNTKNIKQPTKDLIKKHDQEFMAHIDKGNVF